MATENWIDAHTHIWTPDLDRYPLAKEYTEADLEPPSFTSAEFLGHAQPCGVRRAVLIQMTYHGFDNSYVLDTIAGSPGQFVGVAVVDETAEDLPDQLVELRSRGMAGLRLMTINVDADAWVDSPPAQQVFQELSDKGLAACFLCNPGDLGAIDRVCEQYPDLTVVIDHLARIGGNDEIKEEHVAALCGLSKYAKVFVKVSAFYALGASKPPYIDLLPMIRRLRDAMGAGRLMWASDCPYQVFPGHTYRDSIELITEHADFFSGDEKQQLLQGTAEKVFFGG